MSREGGARNEVRIAIIDDHDVVHAGIQAWCVEAQPPIELVGSFMRPSEYFAEYPETPNDVDVVLLDLQIEGNRPDFDTLSKLSDRDQRVIVYSYITTDEVILTCLELGAATYLAKSEGKRHLIEAIHAAHTGTPYVGPWMGKAMLNDSNGGRIKLTEREKQVLSRGSRPRVRTSSPSDSSSRRPRCAPTCNGRAPSTPAWGARRRRNRRSWPGRSKTAS